LEDETFARYADSPAQAKEYLNRAKERRSEPVQTVADGAPVYEAEESFHARSDRKLQVSLRGNKLSVWLDGNQAVADMEVADTEAGNVFLESAWSAKAWSQRNLADDVYDGVYEKLIITENTGIDKNKEKVLFSSELTGWEKFKFRAEQKWEGVLGWFMKYL
jgi:hypothetical protein